MRLKDKIVLVTGASKGIGCALALGVAREGAHVLVNYHTDRAGADTVVTAIAQMGRRAVPVMADIGKVAQIRAKFDTLRNAFGRLDVLINKAGVTGWTSLFEVTEESSYMTGQVFYVDGGWTAQGKIPVDNLEQAMAKNR